MKKLLVISAVMLLVAVIIFSWSLFFKPKDSWKRGLPKNIVKIVESDLAKISPVSMWSFEKCIKEKNIIYISMRGNLNGSYTIYDADGVKLSTYSYGDWGGQVEIVGQKFDLSGYDCEIVIKQSDI